MVLEFQCKYLMLNCLIKTLNSDKLEIHRVLLQLQQHLSILDAKYERAIVDATISSLKHLSVEQKQLFKSLLYKFEYLFDGTLGD
jgi:hypothetical protein